MRFSVKPILAALTATLILATAVSTASAGRLSVNERQFDIFWRELNFSAAGFINVRCPLTLLGSFHSNTIRKVSGALIGFIRHAVIGGSEPPCTGGTFTVRRETLPWHLRYSGFTGTLPRITSVTTHLIGAGFLVSTGGVTCLARTSAATPMTSTIELNTTTGQPTGLTAGGSGIPFTGGFLCEITTASLSGAAVRIARLDGGLLILRLI